MMTIFLAAAWCLTGAEQSLPDDPAYDLRPGFSFSCRVKLDRTDRPDGGHVTVVRKGWPGETGSYWLRVSHKPELASFDFFPNVGDGAEPRVCSGVRPVVGKWYDLAAGWDGTNAWLSVDGKTTRKARPGRGGSCPDDLTVGGLVGEVRDLAFADDVRPVRSGAKVGFKFACDVTFGNRPDGETLIATEENVYLLRYDRYGKDPGHFTFFVRLNGTWEPHVGLPLAVEPGRKYRVVCGWDGVWSRLSVDDRKAESRRTGILNPKPGRFLTGTKGMKVERLSLRNECRPWVILRGFHSREFMPRDGRPFTVVGEAVNCGADANRLDVVAKVQDGATIEPANLSLGGIRFGETRTAMWTVDPGTNLFVDLTFTATVDGERKRTVGKRLYLMPDEAPDRSARAWNPPVRATQTHYVDSAAGNDAKDGLTPATAWRSFKNVNGRTLGPGERLLLKRGSVFAEELKVTAAGAADNWAEIGAYGEGMRPQIRRTRLLDERCALVVNPRHLAVRDLIVCNAGSGFYVWCGERTSGPVLIERCLAHHIEGLYRFNAHGIPEWRDCKGAEGPCPPRSAGLGVMGNGRGLFLRDCETYQCSNGFDVRGWDSVVTRMYCHDNYAHNTSPHPFVITSRGWLTDSVFDASGWHAAHGTMGIMLANNVGFVIRNCHFLNQPDSGSGDQGCIDFETHGDNCVIDRCTFRNNAGSAIEVLGLKTPQARNVRISRCRFDRNNWSHKNGPSEVSVWGRVTTDREVACSNGIIEDNGYVLVPGVSFYRNDGPTTNDWSLVRNRRFDFSEDLDRAYPWGDPPSVDVCGEVWTDRREAALDARVRFNPEDPQAKTSVSWEQVEGRPGVRFVPGSGACAKALLPGEGDYRVNVKADDGTFWRTARTAVHVLPEGAETMKAWTFSRNLDTEGWTAQATGADYEFLPGVGFQQAEAFPVRMVCGDYYVVAVKDSAEACLTTPETQNVGVSFSRERVNRMRIRLQNRTNSRRMRLWWQVRQKTQTWEKGNSVAFDVKPDDPEDSLYEVELPPVGPIKQLKLSFSDGTPVTGTVRIDYIWLGRLYF